MGCSLTCFVTFMSMLRNLEMPSRFMMYFCISLTVEQSIVT